MNEHFVSEHDGTALFTVQKKIAVPPIETFASEIQSKNVYLSGYECKWIFNFIRNLTVAVSEKPSIFPFKMKLLEHLADDILKSLR